MRLLIFAIACAAFGQTAEDLTFEVASVKPCPPPAPNARLFFGPPRGGPGTSDPGQITWSNAALRNILMTAYDVQTYQVTAPAWLATERYDIAAKIPAGATKEQVRIMWQNLLKERFGMALHHESKEFQADELTVAKSGLKMNETDLPADAGPFAPVDGPPKFDKNGMPAMKGSGAIVMISTTPGGATARMNAKGLSSSEIASRFAQNLRRPVIDKTGLTGRYDFVLEYTPDLSGVVLPSPPPGVVAPAGPEPVASEPGSNLPSAVEKQLGLKLTSTKAKLDVIVVDHAEKVPTGN